MNPHTPPRPTSSPTSSQTRDDLTRATSSLVPHPVGGRGRTETSMTHTTPTTPARPRDEVNNIGTCTRCNRPIHVGQPYMPTIPFLGSWAGFSHQHCPGRLRLLDGGQ